MLILVLRREDLTSYPEYESKSENTNLPSTNYGTPIYASPENSYLPSPAYGGPYHKPETNYGFPKPSYGAPTYLPPPTKNPQNIDSRWLWDNLKFKLDLYTIGKIILKIVIFKKIVKFFAIICMLLVLPTLKSKFAMTLDDGDSMEAMDMLRNSK